MQYYILLNNEKVVFFQTQYKIKYTLPLSQYCLMSLFVMMNSDNGYVAADFARKLITVQQLYNIVLNVIILFICSASQTPPIMFSHPGKIETT